MPFGSQQGGNKVARRQEEGLQAGCTRDIMLLNGMLVLPSASSPFFKKPESWAREFTMAFWEKGVKLGNYLA